MGLALSLLLLFSPFVNCHLAPLPSWGWGYPPCFLILSLSLECFLSLSLYVCFLTPLSSVSFCFSFTFRHFPSLPPFLCVCLVFHIFSLPALSPSLCLHLSLSLSPALFLSVSPSPIFCSICLSPSLCVSLPSQGPAGLPGIPGIDGIRGLPGTVIMIPVRGRQAALALGSGVLTQEVGTSEVALTTSCPLVPVCRRLTKDPQHPSSRPRLRQSCNKLR